MFSSATAVGHSDTRIDPLPGFRLSRMRYFPIADEVPLKYSQPAPVPSLEYYFNPLLPG